MTKKFIAEGAGTYSVSGCVTEADILAMAQKLAKARLRRGRKITSPLESMTHLQTLMAPYEQEVFGILLLDTRHRIIKFTELFSGTINASSIYPREVVKLVLATNAAAVIFVHNHPSGDPKPSQSDRGITKKLKDILAVVEVKVLDHVIVAAEGCASLAELGEI